MWGIIPEASTREKINGNAAEWTFWSWARPSSRSPLGGGPATFCFPTLLWCWALVLKRGCPASPSFLLLPLPPPSALLSL
eukprot:9048611-Pyramimonas_sp.AAC.1